MLIRIKCLYLFFVFIFNYYKVEIKKLRNKMHNN